MISLRYTCTDITAAVLLTLPSTITTGLTVFAPGAGTACSSAVDCYSCVISGCFWNAFSGCTTTCVGAIGSCHADRSRCASSSGCTQWPSCDACVLNNCVWNGNSGCASSCSSSHFGAFPACYSNLNQCAPNYAGALIPNSPTSRINCAWMDCGECVRNGCFWSTPVGSAFGQCGASCPFNSPFTVPASSNTATATCHGDVAQCPGYQGGCSIQTSCRACTDTPGCLWSQGRCDSFCSQDPFCAFLPEECGQVALRPGCSNRLDCTSCTQEGCVWSIVGENHQFCTDKCSSPALCTRVAKQCPNPTTIKCGSWYSCADCANAGCVWTGDMCQASCTGNFCVTQQDQCHSGAGKTCMRRIGSNILIQRRKSLR